MILFVFIIINLVVSGCILLV